MAQSANSAGQPTGVPVRKVAAGGLAGAVTTILVWVLNKYVLKSPIEGDIGAAITTVLSFIVSYFIPPSANETVTS
jgi:putative flippase GtrA